MLEDTPKKWTSHQQALRRELDGLRLTHEESAVATLHLVERRSLADAGMVMRMTTAQVSDLVESIQAKKRVARQDRKQRERMAHKAADPAMGIRGKIVKPSKHRRGKRQTTAKA